ncbi:MAG: MBL fold metallo-hydrolase [Clostridiales Family XIII bacterium]|jgi:glyoxylase-like metal-dependent hydrolase (beta-lactamase superfamily II)|nr:MBL fold metallo-hydrolase [Clostridiales Family XIII bacterium]
MEIKRFVGGNLESNGYIIFEKGGDGCYVVDPGYSGEKFLRAAEEAGLRILGILLTHHHHDHVGGVRKIRSAADCPVHMHKDDAGPYKDAVDVLLAGGESIPLGGESLRVLHTPGHTRGSVCFYSERGKAAFTGDTIFNVDLGRTDLEGGSGAAMERSVRETVSVWPNDTMIYPGHGDPCNMRFVRVHNGEYLEIMGEADRYRPWKGESFVL